MIGLADSYSAIGQYNEAIDLYKTYLSKQPSDFEAQYNYALALASVGRMTDAAKEYRKAINLNSNSAEAYYGLGAAYIENDSNLARESWKKYLDLQPQGEFKSEILHRFPDLK
jgi:tetratricopeptide (TPR) repeat protein